MTTTEPPTLSAVSVPQTEPQTVKTRTVEFPVVPGKLNSVREFDIEIEYATQRFPVESGVFLKAVRPLRLGFVADTNQIEVIGWGLKVAVEDSPNLPQRIARRFLALFSKAVTGNLDEQSEACLECVTRDVDYRAFCETRRLPRFREATLVRKSPKILLQFLDEKNIQVESRLAGRLQSLEPGDRFGAWFTTNSTGKILDIKHVLILPSTEESFSEVELLTGGQPPTFPEELMPLLPNHTAPSES